MSKRFLVCGDLHGDMQDDSAVAALLKFDKVWKPQVRIFLGDLWDFRPLRGGASEDERLESMRADYKTGLAFAKQWRPDYFLRGNHDERLWQLRDRGKGVAADYAGELIESIDREFSAMKCKVLPYHKRDGVLRLGHLKCIHGFHAGVFATRQSALIYGSVLMGHTHTVDEHAIPGMERRVARSIGALCRLDMDYNSRQPLSLRHAHGFAYGVQHDDGSYQIWQAEEIKKRWLVATQVLTL